MRYWEHHWQRTTWATLLLLPLAAVFCATAAVRRAAYRFGVLRAAKPPVPVIVIGNISVGGTGKSPVVDALVRELQARGHRPGIVARGYGVRPARQPVSVDDASTAAAVGDEAVAHRLATGGPVVIDRRRARGANYLYAHHRCDVIVADDGLQHYALARDLEIAVVDGTRGLGNGWCLPAGPLRETVRRLRTVDFVLTHGAAAEGGASFALGCVALHRVDGRGTPLPVSQFLGQKVHAVAGIGNPERFFTLLQTQGMIPLRHAFPDHHRFRAHDLAFDDDTPVVMTLKDAVKCRDFARANHYYLEVAAQLPPAWVAAVYAALTSLHQSHT